MIVKKTIIGLVLAGILIILVGCSSTSTSNHTNISKEVRNEKTLIVYYSYTGTVQRIAEHLKQLTGGTLYELTLENPYTGDSNEVSDRVFAERDNGKMPSLSGQLPDISKYDQILIGTPVWNDSMSNPVASYLEQMDFDGKTVAPFWNYITNEGTTGKDFIDRSKNANMAKGLPIRSANSMSDDSLDQLLGNWLSELR